MKVLITIAGVGVDSWSDGTLSWLAKAAVDVDGSGSSHGDTCYQPDTSLHLHGKPLNADVHRYIVVPPQILMEVAGAVLGCKAVVRYNGREVSAVVGDIGPHSKIGELSYACAVALGMNPSPVNGGVDEHKVFYQIWPGVPAVVDGVEFILQPYRA